MKKLRKFLFKERKGKFGKWFDKNTDTRSAFQSDFWNKSRSIKRIKL